MFVCRKLVLPNQTELGPSIQQSNTENIDAVVTNVLNVRKKFFQSASGNIAKAQKESYYLQKLPIGTKVLLRNSIRDSKKGVKMKDKWLGPYIFYQDLENGTL